MFGIESSELMLLAAVALVVIGPKDLPRAMRFVGHWVGRARGMARHFRMGIDEIIRQSELDDMQKKWAAENERIMAEHPMPPPGEEDDAAHALAGTAPVMTALPAPPPSGVQLWEESTPPAPEIAHYFDTPNPSSGAEHAPDPEADLSKAADAPKS
jgi:sec-independent protein translocase protein TatB